MSMKNIGKILTLILAAIVVFAAIQYVGGYLIAKITAFDESEDNVTVEVVEKTILRLEAEDYYTCHVGSFTDKNEAQSKIDAFAQAGYRVFASSEAPYRLLLGAWSAKPDLTALPSEFQNIGSDVSIVKATLNDVSLKYTASDKLYSERIAPLVAAADVVIKHSLKMFEQSTYEQYSIENWQEMINLLKKEIAALEDESLALSLSEDGQNAEKINTEIAALTEKLTNYAQSLEYILSKKDDQALYLAQSYLLELIAQYHQALTNLSF